MLGDLGAYLPPKRLAFLCAGSDLRKVLRSALAFTGTDQSQPHLCQVLFDSDGQELRIVATDGASLYVGTLPTLDDELAAGQHRISAACASRVVDAIKPKDTTRLWFDAGSNSLSRAGGLAWSVELFQGSAEFPPYRHLVPARPGLEPGQSEYQGTRLDAAMRALCAGPAHMIGYGVDTPVKLIGETVEGAWAAVLLAPQRVATRRS
jgi:hypothetical protein